MSNNNKGKEHFMGLRTRRLFFILMRRNDTAKKIAGIAFLVLLPFLYSSIGCQRGEPAAELFEQAWNDFDQNYSYFTYKNVDWDAVKTQNQQNFDKNMTADQFAEEFNNVLQVLHDWHVSVSKPNGEGFGYNGTITTNYPTKPRNSYTQNGYTTIGDVIWHSKVILNGNENIGYIRIDSFEIEKFNNITDQDIENLFVTYADADGLIIDIRPNNGGSEEIAAKFISRFTDEPRVYGYTKNRIPGADHNAFTELETHTLEPSSGTHFNKPVVGLIGQRCMSSAEWCTLMMRACPNLTLIGDKTRGASGSPKEFSLPNKVSYRISIWIAYTDEMIEIEDKGIEPAIKILADQSIDDSHDYVLEKAIEHINSGGVPPSTTSSINAVTTTIPGSITTTIPGGITTTIPGGITTTIPGGVTTTIPSQGGKPIIDSFTVNPTSGQVLFTDFTFICQAHDPDGFIGLYVWDFDDKDAFEYDVITDFGMYQWAYLEPGTYTARVQVYDNANNASDIKSVQVTVTN
jgi:hypothetical protein